MKSGNVKPGTCIKYGCEHNDVDLKFKVGEHVRISKYKNIFAKGTPNWSEEVFLSAISTVKKLFEHFMKESCKRQAKKNSGLRN